jgi:hypothetical protein
MRSLDRHGTSTLSHDGAGATAEMGRLKGRAGQQRRGVRRRGAGHAVEALERRRSGSINSGCAGDGGCGCDRVQLLGWSWGLQGRGVEACPKRDALVDHALARDRGRLCAGGLANGEREQARMAAVVLCLWSRACIIVGGTVY